jgi:hypothetical protein
MTRVQATFHDCKPRSLYFYFATLDDYASPTMVGCKQVNINCHAKRS